MRVDGEGISREGGERREGLRLWTGKGGGPGQARLHVDDSPERPATVGKRPGTGVTQPVARPGSPVCSTGRKKVELAPKHTGPPGVETTVDGKKSVEGGICGKLTRST
jgi:hypothetical protein